jgi:hypothetical protein
MWGLCRLSHQPTSQYPESCSPARRDGIRKPSVSTLGKRNKQALPLCRRPARRPQAGALIKNSSTDPHDPHLALCLTLIRVHPCESVVDLPLTFAPNPIRVFRVIRGWLSAVLRSMFIRANPWLLASLGWSVFRFFMYVARILAECGNSLARCHVYASRRFCPRHVARATYLSPARSRRRSAGDIAE